MNVQIQMTMTILTSCDQSELLLHAHTKATTSAI